VDLLTWRNIISSISTVFAMDFLKKAKASLKDLEGDLNKATASLGLGIGNKDEAASTNTSTTMNTPASSVAPSVVPEASKAKLPLAVRKNGM